MTNWYNREGQPIDVETANSLLGDSEYARVALTRITSGSDPAVEYRVSTIWLGLDHNWSGGEPLLFETMAFGGGEEQDQTQWRWTTDAAARAGHAEIVASIAATVPDEQVEDIHEQATKETDEPQPEPDATVGPHLHKWTTWEDGTATYSSPILPKLGTWKGPVQTRRCTKCGKTDIRKVT